MSYLRTINMAASTEQHTDCAKKLNEAVKKSNRNRRGQFTNDKPYEVKSYIAGKMGGAASFRRSNFQLIPPMYPGAGWIVRWQHLDRTFVIGGKNAREAYQRADRFARSEISKNFFTNAKIIYTLTLIGPNMFGVSEHAR